MGEMFESLSKSYYLEINNKRVSALSLFEAIAEMEVIYRQNENIVSQIIDGKKKAIKAFKGIVMRESEFLIHPEHIDYFLCIKLNGIDSSLV